MKYILICLPLVLTSCATVNQLNQKVRESTESIHCNRMAVERSTEVIQENGRLIDASTQALEKNKQSLEAM